MKKFALVLLMEVLVPAACSAAEPTTLPATHPSAASPWGEQSAGLRARIRIPARLEQNMAMTVEVEMQSEPGSLPAGVTRFNADYFPAYLRMTLVNVASSARVELSPYDPTMGMPPPPLEMSMAPINLNGNAIAPLEASFPLIGKPVAPGEYDCVLDYASDRAKFRKQVPAIVGWWYGRFNSGPARIKIDRETPKEIAIQVPTRIKGRPAPGTMGWQFEIAKDDVETVRLPVRNGCFLTMRIGNGGPYGSYLGLNSRPDLGDVVDQLRRNGSSETTHFVIEICEDAHPPMHLYMPSPDANGYKTLWKKEFDLDR